MNRETEVLDQFLRDFGNPPRHAIENSREDLLDRFAFSNVHFFEVMEIPAATTQPFRFAWAAGIVLAVVLANVVVWRQGPPFSVAVNTARSGDHSVAKSPAEQADATLPLSVPQEVFELASVKLLSPSSEAARLAQPFDQNQLSATGCPGGYMYTTRIDPGRLMIPAATVLTLVMAAYGQDCRLVEGVPEWARSEHYEINALLPAGTPRYTAVDLMKGEAPELQRMLQKLLADRFRLVLKRELREMSVYTLTVATPGKLKVSPDETTLPNVLLPAGFPALPTLPLGRGQDRALILPGEHQMFGHAVSVSALAKSLRQRVGRPVIDTTGFSGQIDYDLRFASEISPPTAAAPLAVAPPSTQPIPPLPGAPSPGAPLPSLRDVLAEQLGLKLESAKMPIEVLIIQSIERPSEN